MREIKYRGKHKNKWVYGYLTSEDYINEVDKLGYTSVDKETVGQYTGFKDKNGKEIYEGDKVYIIPEDEYGEIRWDIESARFTVVYDNIITDFDNWYGKDLEVVGTIYD